VVKPPSIRFVSSNPGKFQEVAEILRPFGIPVEWARQVLPEPQVDSLGEVVAAKLSGLPKDRHCYMVEDSGLFLDGLGGFPGVYSAYVYRTLGLDGVLRALGPRPRSATFRTVAGIRWGDRTWTAPGSVRGAIARAPRGTGGFGYDPIFVPSGERRTFAQLPPAEKDRRSHRGRAVRAVVRRLSAWT
jgi:XTP/dITP diphosphohydrolase